MTSLIPERPLLISPTLAATIGLEEAVMLHVISELVLQQPAIYRNRRRWIELECQRLRDALPFWTASDIGRIHRNLQEKGLLLVERINSQNDMLLVAINQAESPPAAGRQTERSPKPVPPPEAVFERSSTGRASTIPPNWGPDDILYQQCQQQHGIPRSFIDQRIKTFVMFQQERQNTNYSWHNTFLKWIIKEWRQEESYRGSKELESDMSASWTPSEDALSILEHSGISRSFIEDSVPEFVLYWRERGLITSTWNTKFIAHVRRQWAKYNAAVEHDTTPCLIPTDYEPSDACFEVLAMANIDIDFAREQIPEFVMYWRERGEANTSWNTRFLQHVKYKWASQGQSQLPANEQLENTLQRLTDRSWAD